MENLRQLARFLNFRLLLHETFRLQSRGTAVP